MKDLFSNVEAAFNEIKKWDEYMYSGYGAPFRSDNIFLNRMLTAMRLNPNPAPYTVERINGGFRFTSPINSFTIVKYDGE